MATGLQRPEHFERRSCRRLDLAIHYEAQACLGGRSVCAHHDRLRGLRKGRVQQQQFAWIRIPDAERLAGALSTRAKRRPQACGKWDDGRPAPRERKVRAVSEAAGNDGLGFVHDPDRRIRVGFSSSIERAEQVAPGREPLRDDPPSVRLPWARGLAGA